MILTTGALFHSWNNYCKPSSLLNIKPAYIAINLSIKSKLNYQIIKQIVIILIVKMSDLYFLFTY